MAFCRVTFFLLVISVVQILGVQVPVYLWGDLPKSSLKSNPLKTVTGDDFGDVLKTELQDDPFTVIFVEETLSVEDFSLKNADGASSYPYLHSIIGKSLYLPAVDSALTQLNELADPEKVDHVKLTENGLSAEIEPMNGKFLFINFKDAKEGESRADLLRRHNDFMEEMVSNLRERYNSVVAIYTAHYPSWTVSHSRARRQAEAQSDIHNLDGLLLYADRITIIDSSNGERLNLTNLERSNTVFNTSEMNTQLVFSNADVVLNFRRSGGYWFFETVTLNQVNGTSLGDTLSSTIEIYALDAFSYRCADNVTFTTLNNTHTYSLNFLDMKVQPFFQTLNATDMVFGDSFNCVGFFSVPIWSGLFVVFILLAITFYGIMMMMDIRTMDRFDDPKGKTITINAAE